MKIIIDNGAWGVKKSIFLFVIVLLGCSPSPNEPTFEEVKVFFEENKEFLKKTVGVVKVERLIRKIYLDDYVLYGRDKNKEIVAVRDVQNKLEVLGINNVSVVRRMDRKGTPILSVSFTLYAVGLSVSGYSVGIENLEGVNKEVIEDLVRKGGIIYLGEGRWYMFNSR